jgi:hypothetical protein
MTDMAESKKNTEQISTESKKDTDIDIDINIDKILNSVIHSVSSRNKIVYEDRYEDRYEDGEVRNFSDERKRKRLDNDEYLELNHKRNYYNKSKSDHQVNHHYDNSYVNSYVNRHYNSKPYVYENNIDFNKISKQISLNVSLNVSHDMNIPDHILSQALVEVMSKIGWSDYQSYKNDINLIYNSNIKSAFKNTSDNIHGYGRWNVRSFIHTKNEYYSRYSKKDVLLSKQFFFYLKGFCDKILNSEVYFTFYHGYNNTRFTKHLKICKVAQEHLQSSNPDDYVMILFNEKI